MPLPSSPCCSGRFATCSVAHRRPPWGQAGPTRRSETCEVTSNPLASRRGRLLRRVTHAVKPRAPGPPLNTSWTRAAERRARFVGRRPAPHGAGSGQAGWPGSRSPSALKPSEGLWSRHWAATGASTSPRWSPGSRRSRTLPANHLGHPLSTGVRPSGPGCQRQRENLSMSSPVCSPNSFANPALVVPRAWTTTRSARAAMRKVWFSFEIPTYQRGGWMLHWVAKPTRQPARPCSVAAVHNEHRIIQVRDETVVGLLVLAAQYAHSYTMPIDGVFSSRRGLLPSTGRRTRPTRSRWWDPTSSAPCRDPATRSRAARTSAGGATSMGPGLLRP